MPTVDFYSIGSRYSYLASTRLAHVEVATGCRFEWRPVNSLRLLARRPWNPFADAEPSGVYAPAYRDLDVARWASLYGVPFVEPGGRVRFDSDELARACTAARRIGRCAEYSHGLFASMYDGAIDVIDRAVLREVATRCGIDADSLDASIDAADTRTALDASIDRAFEAGAFGVPTFVVDGELFFGNDRLPLLEQRLAG